MVLTFFRWDAIQFCDERISPIPVTRVGPSIRCTPEEIRLQAHPDAQPGRSRQRPLPNRLPRRQSQPSVRTSHFRASPSNFCVTKAPAVRSLPKRNFRKFCFVIVVEWRRAGECENFFEKIHCRWFFLVAKAENVLDLRERRQKLKCRIDFVFQNISVNSKARWGYFQYWVIQFF